MLRPMWTRCALAGLCALLLMAPAAAARPSVKLSRAAAEPGDRVVVAGHGFAPKARVRIALAGRTLRRARTGPRGGFRVRLRVPERAAGAYRLRVFVAGHGFAPKARVRIALAGRTLRHARTGPRGGFRVRLRVPERAAGAYRLRVFVGGRRVGRRFRIRAVSSGGPLGPAQQEPTSGPAQAQPPTASPGPVTPPTPPAQPPAEAPTLVAAGDISCRPDLPETPTACRDAHTANLVESLAPDAVAVLGDLQYEGGEFDNFINAYDPTWGRFKAITHPAPGNHEYEGDPERDAAPGYFQYFGTAAGDPTEGYYRWSLGDWTMFVLNSGAINYTRPSGLRPELPDDCWPVSCMANEPQEQWLRAELATLPADSCVLAYWHHPRFSSGFSGQHQPHPETQPLLDALQEHDADLILAGHSHNYERFKPLSPGGLTQFVVGTGGRNHHVPGPQLATSEVLRADVFGVLELTLASSGWSSRFLAEDGSLVDQAAGGC
jgi:acid phosphatase type 7